MVPLAFLVVEDAHQRSDGGLDLFGVGRSYLAVDAFPWEGEVKVAMIVRRSEIDTMPRHELKFFSGPTGDNDEPFATEQLPGLPADERNGTKVLGFPVHAERAGPFAISIQVDDGPLVTAEFEFRLRSDP